MLDIIVADQQMKDELLSNGTTFKFEDLADHWLNIVWLEDASAFKNYTDAAVVIDLLYDDTHLEWLQSFQNALVVINSVEATLAETDPSFVRINGWPTFLKSSVIEATCSNENNRQKADEVFSSFNKKIEWLPDVPGFVTPRVISMIINEAFIALKEGVSTKEEINTAMKLGTNYPYGPFEWAEKIGVERVNTLLSKIGQPQIQ